MPRAAVVRHNAGRGNVRPSQNGDGLKAGRSQRFFENLSLKNCASLFLTVNLNQISPPFLPRYALVTLLRSYQSLPWSLTKGSDQETKHSATEYFGILGPICSLAPVALSPRPSQLTEDLFSAALASAGGSGGQAS